MEEDKQIINQSNINETEAIINSLSAKNELGELMALYIRDRIHKGGSIYKDVLDYLLEMDFISTEYVQAICSFIQNNATLDWIMLIDTILKTKESETIENFIKEVYDAFKNDMNVEDVKGYVSLAKNPYELHIMIDEESTLKKEYDEIMASITDVNNHLQQKEQEISRLKKELEESKKELEESKEELAESEKRKKYYKTSYKEACEENSTIKDENSKLKVQLSSLKKKIEAEQVKQKEDIEEHVKENTGAFLSQTNINAIYEKLEELLLKMGSVHKVVNEGILCISDNTNSLLEKGFEELLSNLKKSFKEELSNNNQFISQNRINKAKDTPDEQSNHENIYYNVESDKEFSSPFDEEDEEQPINEIEIGEENLNGEVFDYVGDMSNAGLYLESEEKGQENPIENTRNSPIIPIQEMQEDDNDLPSDEEVTNSKELLQTGIQSHEIGKAIKNVEESSPFFLRFKKKMDIGKKVKQFNKVTDDVKKRQMILEEAMANKLDTNIVRGLKELSGMDTVSLEFLYGMACDKNTSIEDVRKLNEYVIS